MEMKNEWKKTCNKKTKIEQRLRPGANTEDGTNERKDNRGD